jgi:hypothetical protein
MVSELFAGLVEPDPEQDGLPDLFLYRVDLLSDSQDVILMGLRNRDNAVRVAAQNIAGQNPRIPDVNRTVHTFDLAPGPFPVRIE